MLIRRTVPFILCWRLWRGESPGQWIKSAINL